MTTIAKDRMLDYLPHYYGNSRVMKEAVLNPQGLEIDKLNKALDETLQQLAVQTATWGLARWEEQVGLPVSEAENYPVRRTAILAKRRGAGQRLVVILQAIEPSIVLNWGKYILPFVILSEVDVYDYGPLIALLKYRKPAHLGYSFRLQPVIVESGYTIYVNRKIRDKLNLEPLSGSFKTGRWPWWSSLGLTQGKIITVQTTLLTGSSFFDFAASFYPGPIAAWASRGSVVIINVGVQRVAVTGTGQWVRAGEGEAFLGNVFGASLETLVQILFQPLTGLATFRYSGTLHCGEVA